MSKTLILNNYWYFNEANNYSKKINYAYVNLKKRKILLTKNLIQQSDFKDAIFIYIYLVLFG